MSFKPGDRVQCVDLSQGGGLILKANKPYTISKVEKDYYGEGKDGVYLVETSKEQNQHNFFAQRFRTYIESPLPTTISQLQIEEYEALVKAGESL